MKRSTLLTLILGATLPAYLQASTGAAAANANAAASAQAPASASAADVKSSAAVAADVKSAADQQQNKVQVPDDIIPKEWSAFGTAPRIDETHCQRIIDWIKEDPQNRKNARCERSGFRILSALYYVRFDKKIGALQPALDFLISLKPATYFAAAPKKSFQLVYESSSFSLLRGTMAPSDPKGQADFHKFVRQLTRLIFLNGRNLLQIQEDAAYIKAQLEAELQPERRVYHANATIPLYNNEIDTFKVALAEVETIREEAVARIALASSKPFDQALLPDLQRIVTGYSTELTLAEAQRALAELSAPQQTQPAQ